MFRSFQDLDILNTRPTHYPPGIFVCEMEVFKKWDNP